MNSLSSKIVLGTVQFGLTYGINNKTGIPNPNEFNELLKFANHEGIDTLDTAYNYGISEQRIGKFLRTNKIEFRIISKAPSKSNSENINKYFNQSLNRLCTGQMYGYLLHDFNDYINDKKILISLSTLKEKGKVGKIGFSLYHPEQLEKLLNDNIEFDLIQLPYNLADRRFETYFPELREREIEVHTRSVFLQGLFFMNPDELPTKLKPFKELLQKLKELSKKNNRNIENITLNFALQNEFINNVVLGIDNIKQLTMNLNEVNHKLNDEEIRLIDLEMKKIKIPQELLIPSNWK